MRNFIIFVMVVFAGMWVANDVLANTLYDLYSDHSGKQVRQEQTSTSKFRKNNKHYQQNTSQYNNIYMPNYSKTDTVKTLSDNTNDIVKQGSQNYGQYGLVNKRTNPLRFDNPYNELNDKMIQTRTQVETSTVNYDGDAVRFKRGADGNLYGYNKYGKKIGVYRVNNNGTTTQYDMNGNRMGTFK